MFEFRLDEDIFDIVKSGTKRVECRLYDKKRKGMKVGDELIFLKRPLEQEKIVTKIIGLKTFSNFNELVKNYEMESLYSCDFTKEEFVELLGRFYSDEEQVKYGVVAIEFEMVK